jgi:hypothetical protein
VVEGRRETELFRGWAGLSLGAGTSVARRLIVGWDALEQRYEDWSFVDTGAPYPSPEELDVSGPRVGYEQVANSFEVLKGFRAWSSQEDIGLGPNFFINATFSAPAVGGDIKRILVESRFSIARHSGRWLVLGDAWGSGRIDEGDPRNLLIGGQVAAAQIGERGFQLRLLVEATHELDLDRQLTLGADVGLRGWNPDFFDGTGRALLNAQWRTILARNLLKFFTVGGTVFVDAGSTWDARVGRDTDGIRVDAGVGIIIDLSRFSTSNLLRIDVGWPDDGSGPVVTIGTSALF